MRRLIVISAFLAALLAANVARAETKPTDSGQPNGTSEFRTAFKLDSLKTLDAPILQTDAPKTSDAELDLLKHARRGKMEQWSMAKAALTISGVIDEDEQKHYLDQLAQIAKACKEATADSRS